MHEPNIFKYHFEISVPWNTSRNTQCHNLKNIDSVTRTRHIRAHGHHMMDLLAHDGPDTVIALRLYNLHADGTTATLFKRMDTTVRCVG